MSRLRTHAFSLGAAALTAAVGTFLLVQLHAWPSHEDETLALFVGRQPFGELIHTVLGERGGAPLHFFLAWIVAHLGGGLTGLRLVSAFFATASIPVIALLCRRLAGPAAALAATLIVAGSWILLFHGVYGRMYSLFLFLSSLSYLLLLRALERGGRRQWAPWAIAMALTIASHPYGAIVLGTQGLYVLLTRQRVREAVWPFVAVFIACTPMWRADIVLAGRFDVGVGGGGEKLGSLTSVIVYLRHVAGDFTVGDRRVLFAVLAAALIGLVQLIRTRPRSALLGGIVVLTPTIALMMARLGSSTSPESRHLIFAAPFFALAVAVGILTAARANRIVGPVLAVAVLAAFLPAEVSWAKHRTPQLINGESQVRIRARHEASAWLAATSRPDDVLFGYEPLYLEAWERSRGSVSVHVVPRADAKLAARALLDASKNAPLGRGVWVFDKSEANNYERSLSIPLKYPSLPWAFEARVFGPFLIIRTRAPTRTPRTFLKLARRVELVGKIRGLDIGDADINLNTALNAGLVLDRYELSRSRSTVSR